MFGIPLIKGFLCPIVFLTLLFQHSLQTVITKLEKHFSKFFQFFRRQWLGKKLKHGKLRFI